MIVQTIIDIQKVFENTWGYIALPYPEILVKRFLNAKVSKTAEYDDMQQGWIKNYYSDLGVPLYHSDEQYTDLFLPIWLFEKDNADDKYLLPLSIMSMTCRKNIVTTPLVNRNGTVKEEISREDWEINVRGVMVGFDNNYPEEQVQLLNDWWEKSAALNIENAKTAICLNESEKVVITSLSLPEVKGFENTQPYEMKLISDIPFSLYL